MRCWAAILPMVLAAPAASTAPRREAPPPPPAVTVYPPPMIVADPKVAIDPPPPAWIAATRAPEFRKCAACHNVERDGKNGVGPNLYGAFGRPAASRPDYRYSPQLRESGLVWDFATLDRWLASPRALVPGAKMTFSGLKNAEERKAVIAFLRLRSEFRP